MTRAATLDRIEAVIQEIRPTVRADGGDVEFVDFDQEQGLVELRLLGACHTCPYAIEMLMAGIEHRLRIKVPEVKGVVEI